MSDNLSRSYVGTVLLGLALTGATGLCLYLLMRKEEDREGEVQGGVTSRQVNIDVKIPKDSVGVVIGRQGCNIREIMDKTGTTINFRDELETEKCRVACIRGLPDDVQMAEILMHQTISLQPKLETLTMHVPGRAVGRIIGRGGENVREIQRVSRCKVDIERGGLGEGMEKKIVLKGDSKHISMAKKLIEDKVKEEDMSRSYVAVGVSGRQLKIQSNHKQFVNYEHEDHLEINLQTDQGEVKTTLSESDNSMEVSDVIISTAAPLAMSDWPADKLTTRNIFDCHCHIDFILNRKLHNPALKTYNSLVEKYPAMHHDKLEGFITNYCDPSTWPVTGTAPPAMLSSAWVTQGLSVHYTVGCHPHFAAQLLREGAMETLERLLVEGRGRGCVAVGECGLDCSRKNGVDMDVQIEAFKLQVKLAMRLNLPLVLHIRDAEDEGIAVLQSCGLPMMWPVHRHCWNDSWEVCQAWLELYPGSVVGITGLVTYRHAYQAREVARLLPLDRLVLETDAPYFRPQYSGVLPPDYLTFAHPVQVVSVAAQIAEVRGIGLEQVLSECRENVARIYRIPVPGERIEAVEAVKNIIEDLIEIVADNVVNLKMDHCKLKRLSENLSGGETKKLRTVVDHFVTQGIDCQEESVTPGSSGPRKLPLSEGGVTDPVSVVGQILEELITQVDSYTESQQEEFSLRMIGYNVPCEVYVSALCTPGEFWVQKIGPRSVDLDKLTYQMTEYYNEEENQKFHSVTSAVPGDIVASRFASEDSYFRARVVAVKEDLDDDSQSTVDLHFVDYGDFEQKFINEIYQIRIDFLKLKFQAIQCSLAHLKPEPGLEWSVAACDQLEMMTDCARWKVLIAKVVEYQSSGVPCVELVDTNHMSIGYEMVKQGLASWVESRHM